MQITGLSVEYMKCFKFSVDNTADAVGGGVEQMQSFLTKCQELNQNLKPVEELAKQLYDSRPPPKPTTIINNNNNNLIILGSVTGKRYAEL